jgi:hypothetical protein
MSPETSGAGVPEFLDWDGLRQLPEQIAAQIELWNRKVVWNRRGPLEHQRFTVRMRNVTVSNARHAVEVGQWEPGDAGIEFPEPFGIRITWDDLAF